MMQMQNMDVAKWVYRSVFLLSLAVTGGCGVDFAYLLPAAAGQIELLQRSVPVEQAIVGGGLSDEQVAKLSLIQDVRLYARDAIGLNVADNYTTFYDSGGEPVAYNVSASRKDAFQPRLWTFPIVGTVPYLGYFDFVRAEAKRNELADQGFDVFMYQIDAYSGIGFFPNPILSPMLNRDELDLIDTVIHELLHSTIWRSNDTSFNESLATFFGRRGTLAYLADNRPEVPDRQVEAVQKSEDIDRYNGFALELYNELDAFYSSDLSREAKIRGRDAIFQAGRDRFEAEIRSQMNIPDNYEWVMNLPVNNAWMLGIRRYNLDLDVFELVFQTAGEDWQTALEVFRASAKVTEPYTFLRNWLDSQQNPKARMTDEIMTIHKHSHVRTTSEQGATRGPCACRLATTQWAAQ